MPARHAMRIYDIDFTISTTGNDIFEADAVTFYRDAVSRAEGNGVVIKAQQSDGEGGTKSDLDQDSDLSSSELWVWLGEVFPPPSVIVLDLATT